MIDYHAWVASRMNKKVAEKALVPMSAFAQKNRTSISHADFINALYRKLLHREPDAAGYSNLIEGLESGLSADDILGGIFASSEFQTKNAMLPRVSLPNLRDRYPSRYETENGYIVFRDASNEDISQFEADIHTFRYYDSAGVYSVKIDDDKRLLAKVVRQFAPKSCLEIGCFTGPVLSLLEEAGVDIVGVDASHLAFLLAYDNVRPKMIFGDLMDLKLERTFDVILATDILEHINPTRLGAYLARLRSLLSPNGRLVLNSPMFGRDPVFGEVFPPYINSWKSAGDHDIWRDIHCDDLGWPLCGHLVWASAAWWDEKVRHSGFVRDADAEASYHSTMGSIYKGAPARKTTFVLKQG